MKRPRPRGSRDIFRKISLLAQFFLNGDPARFGLVIQLKVRNPSGDGVVIELFGTTRSVMDAVGGANSNFIPLFSLFLFSLSLSLFLRKLVMCSRANFTGELSPAQNYVHFAARNTRGEIVRIICKVFQLRASAGDALLAVINKFRAVLNIMRFQYCAAIPCTGNKFVYALNYIINNLVLEFKRSIAYVLLWVSRT